MILQRRTDRESTRVVQESLEWVCYGDEAHLDFREFGDGSEKTSWLEIRLGWKDVEAIVEAMANKGHGEADRVRNALKLAEAVKAVTNSHTC